MSQPTIGARLRRGIPTTTTVTYALASLAWLALFTHHYLEPTLPSHGEPTAMHVTGPGVPEAVATAGGPLAVLSYLAMWCLMIVAMMYPSSAGLFQWYADRIRQRRSAVRPAVTAFVAGYTLLWVLVGVVPLAVDGIVSLSSLAQQWGELYFGVALLAVAGFQFTSFKHRCLSQCRFPPNVDENGVGSANALRLGWSFGRLDFGSCGALMGLMVLVGSLNLLWMAVIAAVIGLERLSARGELWAKVVGLVATLGGVGFVALWMI